jgi:transcriptional regulator with XRE-family HTH domain/tetratricopeptide (TPR) repeat protein
MVEKGLNQSKLAAMCGLSQATISKILSGDREKLRHETICAIAEALETNLEYLTGKRGNISVSTYDSTGSLRLAEKSPATRVMLSKLPLTTGNIFGREKEVEFLEKAWMDAGTMIVSFVAWGGVGKTSLVNEWLNRMLEKKWAGAECVYGWSFYSQGTKEDRQASSDTFLVNALEWFGDKETAESAKSAWDKGARLAELIRRQKTLLILDGVEPLQYPPGPMQGRLKDQGLQGLLRELARGINGLCVITTRESIEDLEGQIGHTVKQVVLGNLSKEAGMQILRKAGVTKGTDEELQSASVEFGGHALALTLLGNYLSVVYDGEIRKRDLVTDMTEEERKGGHAKRVMESYEIWLKGTAEIDILYLMGLFDRPAESGAIAKLRALPAIEGFTQNIVSLSKSKWRFAVKRLRDMGLLGKEKTDGPDDLDCHPLVREYFGEKLRQNKPDAWREAHSRLYEYCKSIPRKEYPDTVEEMEPLLRAVYHGCAAGRHQETLKDVYWRRIKRGNEDYNIRYLGAVGSDLSAVACFFERLWDKPAAGLSEQLKTIVLHWAGFVLRSVGWLREAVEPMQAGMQASEDEKDLKGAGQDASNLSELYLILGELEKAIEFGQRSVKHAEGTVDKSLWMIAKTALADALHQFGRIVEAQHLFEEAELIQKEVQEDRYPYLYSFAGYKYCDLLISLGKYANVKERANQTLEWAKERRLSLWTLALDKLSLGRAILLEKQSSIENKELTVAKSVLDEAGRWFDEAVNGLRKAGTQHELPRGLFARAGYYRITREYDKAWADLHEAIEIAERGEMKLWLTDYHLEAGRMHVAQGKKKEAKYHCEEAWKLIEKCGYHRRDKELGELEASVQSDLCPTPLDEHRSSSKIPIIEFHGKKNIDKRQAEVDKF